MGLEKICTACKQGNPANTLICLNCGVNISAIIPTVKNEFPESKANSEFSTSPLSNTGISRELEKICTACKQGNPANTDICLRCRTDISTIIPTVKNDSPKSLVSSTPTSGESIHLTQRESNPLTLITEHEEKFTIHSNDMLGRDSVAACYLTDEHVSNKHAIIVYKNNNWFIKDNNSTNGTYLNGRKLDPGEEFPILSGDTISLSKHVKLKVK